MLEEDNGWRSGQYPERKPQEVGDAGLNDLLYILAGNYDQAVYSARMLDVPRDRMRYIVDDRSLRGIDGREKTLYVCGTAWERKDYRELLDLAAARGFTPKNV